MGRVRSCRCHSTVARVGGIPGKAHLGRSLRLSTGLIGSLIGSNTHEGCATDDEFVYSVPSAIVHSGDNVVAVEGIDRGGDSFLDMSVTSAILNGVAVTLKASGPYGSSPNLASLSASDPTIQYDPPDEAGNVRGTLTCSTTATPSSSASGNPYPVSNCSGLTDQGKTIWYDYADSSFTITKVKPTLA